jgi:hypothetical protein
MWPHVQLWKCVWTEFSLLPFDHPCPHKEDSHPFQYGYDIVQLDSIHSNRATLGAQPSTWFSTFLKRVVCQKLSTRIWQIFKLITILCNLEHLPWWSVWDPAS